MSTTWKARPTVYRGIQMRSRLEATAAAMFDEAEVPWEYEPRAYAGRRGQYLPDFQMDETVFVEVKPTREHALSAQRRMEVILESLPDAVLIIMWPDERRKVGATAGWASRLSHPDRRDWHGS